MWPPLGVEVSGATRGPYSLSYQLLCPLAGVTYPAHSRDPWSLVDSDTPR